MDPTPSHGQRALVIDRDRAVRHDQVIVLGSDGSEVARRDRATVPAQAAYAAGVRVVR